MQPLSLPCPDCGQIIAVDVPDGEVVECPICGATGEVHHDTALDLTTGRHYPVRLIEMNERPTVED